MIPAHRPIELIWGQRLAAFWSIFWPSMAATLVVLFFGTSFFSLHTAQLLLPVLGLAAQVIGFVCQFALIHRLLHKKYRTFRIVLLREDCPAPTRWLSFAETGSIWIRTSWPQVALLVVASLITQNLDARHLQGVTSLGIWVRILLVGPFAIDRALSARYRGFRLQPIEPFPQIRLDPPV